MAKVVYKCEKCGALYDFGFQAEQCEKDHKGIEQSAFIKHFIWKHDPTRAGEFPLLLVVQFPAVDGLQGKIATYRLDRIGYEGRLSAKG